MVTIVLTEMQQLWGVRNHMSVLSCVYVVCVASSMYCLSTHTLTHRCFSVTYGYYYGVYGMTLLTYMMIRQCINSR